MQSSSVARLLHGAPARNPAGPGVRASPSLGPVLIKNLNLSVLPAARAGVGGGQSLHQKGRLEAKAAGTTEVNLRGTEEGTGNGDERVRDGDTNQKGKIKILLKSHPVGGWRPCRCPVVAIGCSLPDAG